MGVDTSFRVIIVGAGPIGLYLAHALAAANIDFVVLEQQPTVLNYSGAVIFTWPHSVRLLDQIGVLKQAQRASVVQIHTKKRVSGQDGGVITTSRFWELMRENHGYPFLPILRSDLVKLLYESLPKKDTKVMTSAEVVDIKMSETEVQVHLKSGMIQRGSVVVGADGVHSSTRTIMQRLARNGGENPMLTSFRGLLGRAPNNQSLGLQEGVFFESRGGLAAVQCSAAGDTVFFATLTPVPGGKPTQIRRRYTQQEMEEHAAALADVWVAPGLQFRDLWAAADKNKTGMLNQEEGFLKGAWHHGRIVLVGDSVHKTTSINGLGLTNGLHSAAVLANELQDLVASSPSEVHVDQGSLSQAFERYQRERQGEAKEICERGWGMIREITQSSWASRIWDYYVLPWVDTESAIRGLFVSMMLVRHGQALSFVPFDSMHGMVPWLKRPAASKEKTN